MHPILGGQLNTHVDERGGSTKFEIQSAFRSLARIYYRRDNEFSSRFVIVVPPNPQIANGQPITIVRTGTFKGDWNEKCSFCGRLQSVHKTVISLENEILEHRIPCAQEKNQITRLSSKRVQTAKVIVFALWVLLPFAVLLIEEVGIIGRVVFWMAIAKLLFEAIKIFGTPEKWFPSYGRKMEKNREEERRKPHYVNQCERNPEGFLRLVAENFDKELK